VNVNDQSARLFLRRADAAAYIRNKYGFPCSKQWLAKLAVIGGGPKFRKAGRFPIYAPAHLDEWACTRIGPVVGSTSEADSTPAKRDGDGGVA
jgi:hypothetical protein